MNDRRNFFDQPVKNDLRTYDYIGKIIAAQEDDYTNGYLLDDTFFKNYYKIAMNLSTQKTLDADPSAIKQKNEIKEIYIDQEIQQSFSLLKKQKNLFRIFYKLP